MNSSDTPVLPAIGPTTGSQFTRLVLLRMGYSEYMELTGKSIWECSPTWPETEALTDSRVITSAPETEMLSAQNATEKRSLVFMERVISFANDWSLCLRQRM